MICPLRRLISTWAAQFNYIAQNRLNLSCKISLFFWKYRRLSLNFDKFLCPFTSSPWGFYAHSFILSAVTSWGREACSGIRDSALTFSYKSNWLPSELCSSDIANGQLEVIDIQLVFHSQRRRLKISNGTDCLFFKRLIMHIHKILLDKEDMPSSFNSP